MLLPKPCLTLSRMMILDPRLTGARSSMAQQGFARQLVAPSLIMLAGCFLLFSSMLTDADDRLRPAGAVLLLLGSCMKVWLTRRFVRSVARTKRS
jgi:hypothetical protein